MVRGNQTEPKDSRASRKLGKLCGRRGNYQVLDLNSRQPHLVRISGAIMMREHAKHSVSLITSQKLALK